MNHLYYGDNLRVLRDHIADASVDLIYLDPPFNSNASYNVLFKSPEGHGSGAQIEAFGDTWEWGDAASDAYREVLRGPNTAAAEMLAAMRGFLGENAMMAYLAMMAVRLIELHRVLKRTGSLYLHCDPTASHYLKLLLDAVFGARNFRNEIVWKRYGAHNDVGQGSRHYGRVHDIVLFYARTADHCWNQQFERLSDEYVKSSYRYIEEGTGRRFRVSPLTGPGGAAKGNAFYEWKGHSRYWRLSYENMKKLHDEGRIYYSKTGYPGKKLYLDESKGTPVQSVWADIGSLSGGHKERLGYQTQKPVALLERIISASSDPDGVVLDPFCGCGTTVHAAEKLGRAWIGIDVTHLAINLIRRRLGDAFGHHLSPFALHGIPTDLDGARALAEHDKHQFELWAISLIPNAQPHKGGQKGADQGIDGVLWVQGSARKDDRCIIEVKGGKVGSEQVRSLKGAMDRTGAPMGILVTLNEPTGPMRETAASYDHWETEWGPVPRVQIVTIRQLLESPVPPLRLPVIRHDTHRKAAREKRTTDQGALDL